MSGNRSSLAKISAPRLFGIVARERLFARLDENRGRPLIWIEGPPGAGKTTLAASYLEARGMPALWYQLDAGDVDPASFFHYLAIAVSAVPRNESASLPRLVAEHLTDVHGFARGFLRELFACLPSGAVLVLDNYQEVGPQAILHAILQAGASEVPRGSSIIAISRCETPASFSQLSASGALFALRWDALRLTLEETRAISHARDIRDEWLVRALHQQAEGWAAGITLMLERLGHIGADGRELPTVTREAVFDYFASLLFDHAPEQMRKDLLALAYIPYASASMAGRLTGDPEAGQLLEGLYRRRLFTDRRPGPEPIYQFHALFRDFLLRRAGEAMSAADAGRLISVAAEALIDVGDVEQGIQLYLSAQQWPLAVDIVLREADAVMKSARCQTLESWIGLLPPAVQDAHPRVLYWLGVAQAHSNPAVGLATLQRAHKALVDCGDREGKIRCLGSLLDVSQIGHAAIPLADAWLGELLDELQSATPSAGVRGDLPIWAAIVSVMVYWRPWHPLAAEAIERMQALLLSENDPAVALPAAASSMVMWTMIGGLDAAEQIVAHIEPLVQHHEAAPGAKAWFLYGVAYLRFVQTRYEEALAYFDRAIEAASSSGLQDTLSDIRLYRVMVEFRCPGWQVADVSLRKIESRPLPRRPMSVALLRIFQARRAHMHGRWEEAAELAIACQEAIEKVGAPENLMTFSLFNAGILIGAGRLEPARALLRRSSETVARSPILSCWCSPIALVQAFLAHREGRGEACRTNLGLCLGLAEEGHGKYYLRYMECSMPPMFSLALREGIKVEFVQRLIRMFRLKPPPDAPDAWPRPIRIWTLGRFEVEIDGKPLEFSRKVPKKTLALLKALIASRHEDVPEQWLCDALWGDEEADAARQVLGVTLARLRKLLGSDEVLIHQGGKIRLDRQACWVDAWRLDAALEQPETRMPREVMALYAGAFLPEDDGEPWSVATRERLRGKFIHALALHGTALEAEGNLEDAARLYLRGIDADVVVEAFHQGLMRCYLRMGRLTEAISAYRRLRQTLSAVLGVKPSVESEAVYREVMRELAATPDPSAARH